MISQLLLLRPLRLPLQVQALLRRPVEERVEAEAAAVVAALQNLVGVQGEGGDQHAMRGVVAETV